MKTLRKFLVLAAFLCCLDSIAVPAAAADPKSSADDFGISFTLRFFNNGVVEEPLEAYQQNSFLLTDSSGWYLQAEYNAADNAYHLTGWTLDEAAATRLWCGQSPEEPGRVAIVGLPEGVYYLTQDEPPKGYWGLHSPLKIFLSSVGSSLNGDPCPMRDDSVVSFFVMNQHSFRMPATCRWCKLQYALQDGILTVETVLITVIFTLAALKIYRTYREEKHAKVAFATMLVSLLVPVCLLILCLAGLLSFTHRLGPVIGSLSGAAYSIFFIAAGYLALRK